MARSKDDGLAQRICAIYLQAILHQIAQHGVDGTEVDDVSANMSAFNLCTGEVDVFFISIGKTVLKGLLFFFSQIIVEDAAAHLIRGLVQHGEANKILIVNGFFQFIGKVRLAVLQLEGIVGALVFLAARGRSQTDHQRIEIVEQRAVFLEDGAVRFIDDDQIKSAHTEFTGIVIDQIDHGLIGRKDNTCVGVPVKTAAGIQRSGHIGQQLIKILMRLTHKAGAVSEKQHVLDPARLHQHIHTGNGHAGFARAGRHDQEAPAAHVGKRFAHAADSVLLVITVGDSIVNHGIRDILSHAAAQLQQFQFLNGMEVEHAPGRIAQLIDAIDIVTVGVIHHGLIAVFLFQLVRLVYALGAAFDQVLHSGRIFNNRQRLVVPATQHIIHRIAAVQLAVDGGSGRHIGIGTVDHGPACLAQRCLQEEFLILAFIPAMLYVENGIAQLLGIYRTQFRCDLHLDRLNRRLGHGRSNGSRLQGRLFELRIIRCDLHQDADFAHQKMQLLQHLQRLIHRERSLMHRHIAHLADIVDGVEENLIIHILNEAVIRGHFEHGFSSDIINGSAIKELHHILHRLARRGDADIGLAERKLLRFAAVGIQLRKVGRVFHVIEVHINVSFVILPIAKAVPVSKFLLPFFALMGCYRVLCEKGRLFFIISIGMKICRPLFRSIQRDQAFRIVQIICPHQRMSHNDYLINFLPMQKRFQYGQVFINAFRRFVYQLPK